MFIWDHIYWGWVCIYIYIHLAPSPPLRAQGQPSPACKCAWGSARLAAGDRLHGCGGQAGRTVLHAAARGGHAEAARVLAEAGGAALVAAVDNVRGHSRGEARARSGGGGGGGGGGWTRPLECVCGQGGGRVRMPACRAQAPAPGARTVRAHTLHMSVRAWARARVGGVCALGPGGWRGAPGRVRATGRRGHRALGLCAVFFELCAACCVLCALYSVLCARPSARARRSPFPRAPRPACECGFVCVFAYIYIEG